jgi:hypothetical protein
MKIQDYLPTAGPQDTKLIQGKVDKDLRKKTREKLKRENVSWDQFMTAACKAYLSEPVPKK